MESLKEKCVGVNKVSEIDFWEEIRSFNFQASQIHSLNEDYSVFLEGVKHLVSMDFYKAEEVFKTLYLSQI